MFAEVYELQKQTDLAVEEYRKALAIKPTADTWVLLARLFRSVNQTTSERQAIDEALKIEPANVAAANRKAELDGLRIPGRRRIP
jgi:Tfp pilus assembly protein PilF